MKENTGRGDFINEFFKYSTCNKNYKRSNEAKVYYL